MTLTSRQLINRGSAIGAGAVALSFGMSAGETEPPDLAKVRAAQNSSRH